MTTWSSIWYDSERSRSEVGGEPVRGAVLMSWMGGWHSLYRRRPQMVLTKPVIWGFHMHKCHANLLFLVWSYWQQKAKWKFKDMIIINSLRASCWLRFSYVLICFEPSVSHQLNTCFMLFKWTSLYKNEAESTHFVLTASPIEDWNCCYKRL